VCHGISVEPSLLPLVGEQITSSSANCSDSARADIHARDFWGRRQGAFFDVRVFHPNAPSYRQSQIASLFRRHELEKKHEYGDSVRTVDGESFTPLVFSTFGGLGKESTILYNRLTDLLSQKHNTTYHRTLSWMRCSLPFSLLRSEILAIRGSRKCQPVVLSGVSTKHSLVESEVSL